MNTKLIRTFFFAALLFAAAGCKDAKDGPETTGPDPAPALRPDLTKEEYTYSDVEYRKKNSGAFGSWTNSGATQTCTIDGMNHLPVAVWSDRDVWGGRTDKAGMLTSKTGKTGFFGTGKIGDRWYFVTPEGNPMIVCGTQHIAPIAYDQNPSGQKQSAFTLRYGTTAKWNAETAKLLTDYGFNYVNYGAKRIERFPAECEQAMLNPAPGRKMAEAENLYMLRTFMWDYYSIYKYPFDDNLYNRLVLVFDPQFEAYCDKLAKTNCALFAGDTHFLGYYLDNELPFNAYENGDARQGVELAQFLALPEKYKGARDFAGKFLADRGRTPETFTAADRTDFRGAVAREYFRITAAAVRRYDPDHLILGSRLHDWSKYNKATVEACAEFCDVISVNYYARWQPEPDFMANLRVWADKPVVISEFYVKAENAGYRGTPYTNLDGGGWMVRTQADRGRFYQNFCIRLIEEGNCAGWVHFQYNDNYGDGMDSNKGIVSTEYEPYAEFLGYMGDLHNHIYKLADYFDAK